MAGRAYSFTQPSQSYRAPELLFNCKVYDGEAVDMWAVGCILAELLRARPSLVVVAVCFCCVPIVHRLHACMVKTMQPRAEHACGLPPTHNPAVVHVGIAVLVAAGDPSLRACARCL